MTCARPLTALAILLLATLACRPVLTIGTGELLVFFALLLALLGPPLFRFWRRWEAFKRNDEQKRKK
jgi:hypothetical protein